MPWVISNTSTKSPQLYCFDVSSLYHDWRLTSLHSVQYEFDGSILLSPETLTELSTLGVAVFETKKSAKQAFKLLGIATCRYVELQSAITKEFMTRPFTAESNWTDLNKHI
jgi:hypothetical protein